MMMRTGTIADYHEYINSEPWGPREPFCIDIRSIPPRLAPPKRAAAAIAERCPRCGTRAIVTDTHIICLRTKGGCAAMTALDEVTALRRALARHGA